MIVDKKQIDEAIAKYEAQRKVNPYNREGLTRPRPVYVIPAFTQRKIDEGFPDRNRIDCANGVHLKWKQGAWAKPDYDCRYVQTRRLYAAICRDDVLLGAATFIETRNPHRVKAHPYNYFDDCDAVSQELMSHAEVVLHARRCFLGDFPLEPQESFVEIESLFIKPDAKGKPV